MSEEYLKQLNEKLAKAEEQLKQLKEQLVKAEILLESARPKIFPLMTWQRNYDEYLKAYNKVANSTIEISNIDANDIHDPICPYCGGTEHILLNANDDVWGCSKCGNEFQDKNN